MARHKIVAKERYGRVMSQGGAMTGAQFFFLGLASIEVGYFVAIVIELANEYRSTRRT
jgi:hypothetical protein